MPDFALERARGAPHRPVAGVDEAGRGPWAGPVVAAAAMFLCPPPPDLAARLDDSKRLSAAARASLLVDLQRLADAGGCALAVGQATVPEIDRLNVLVASLTAMTRAVAALPRPPAHALIDGDRLPAGLPCPAETVVKGDARALSIAAASIVAKVTRDRLMADLDARHPGYGWARNAGYGTAEHRAALARLGPTPHHRRSFAPVARLLRG